MEEILFKTVTALRVEKTQERIVRYYITIPRQIVKQLNLDNIVKKPLTLTVKRRNGRLVFEISYP